MDCLEGPSRGDCDAIAQTGNIISFERLPAISLQASEEGRPAITAAEKMN